MVGEIVKLTEVKLKDISKNNRGYYGIGASAVDYDENKYTYLRITDINDDGTINTTALMCRKYILDMYYLRHWLFFVWL